MENQNGHVDGAEHVLRERKGQKREAASQVKEEESKPKKTYGRTPDGRGI